MFGFGFYSRAMAPAEGASSDEEDRPLPQGPKPEFEGLAEVLDGGDDDAAAKCLKVEAERGDKRALAAAMGRDEAGAAGGEAAGAPGPRGADEEDALAPVKGMCIECGDQPEAVRCLQCEDVFCDVCFLACHRRGNRAKHQTERLAGAPEPLSGEGAVLAGAEGPMEGVEAKDGGGGGGGGGGEGAGVAAPAEAKDADAPKAKYTFEETPRDDRSYAAWVDRAKYTPLRLSYSERKKLRLVESALFVSEYTDVVDVYTYRSRRNTRIVKQLRDICAILSGLLFASDYRAGQKLLRDRDFKDNADLFKDLFEIARRYKIMNPEKLRSEYGKLLYLLQDSAAPEIQEMMGFSAVRPIKTVFSMLSTAGDREGGRLDILADEAVAYATAVITADGRERYEIQRDIDRKNAAVKFMKRKYTGEDLSEDDIELCLVSFSDSNAFLIGNRDPADKMIEYLERAFKPEAPESREYSLAIFGGCNGSRLTHSHAAQYHYAKQSLTLWSVICNDMYKLWFLAEDDLLDMEDSPYHLTDTGQGLNRVQRAPRVANAMRTILHKVQKRAGRWVGSTVVHLGDRAVPNCLMFIDKYTQVARILRPIVLCLERLGDLTKNPKLARLIRDEYGGVDKCRMDILVDFYRSAFDGSGAENYFDAGSCIDGRLTSAWNWCSNLEKKPFFPVFLLTGFMGFDGDFQR